MLIKSFGASLVSLNVLLSLSACGSNGDATAVEGLNSKTLLDLSDVKANPDQYQWFDFRPNVEKLILAGDADTEHVAILWYTVTDGAVGLHYHAKTESVFVMDGTQTDAKGIYPTGTMYFNPPGSGHAIMDSSGFFLLAYAAPPDFTDTDLIEDYTPVRIDTTDPELMGASVSAESTPGLRTFDVPIDAAGGMAGQFIELTPGAAPFEYMGNYVLVLSGSCQLSGVPLGEKMLAVTKAVVPESFTLLPASESCLALGVSFLPSTP